MSKIQQLILSSWNDHQVGPSTSMAFCLESPTLLVDELPCAVDQVMEEAWNGFLDHEEDNKSNQNNSVNFKRL